jgi:ubiquinone/menaquinone biosynthesis C-methylase UbiE
MPSFSFPHYLAAKKTVDDRALNHLVWQTFANELQSRNEILEIGAGIGTMIERLLERGVLKHGTYTALDEQSENIVEAQRRQAQWYTGEVEIKLALGDAFGFIQQNKKYDVLIAHAVLDLFDVPTALPKLLNCLKSKGLFYFTINFDGATIWQPTLDMDDEIEALYHRTMDERVTNGKRSGDSRAGRHLFENLRASGAKILAAGSSDWVVFAKEGAYEADERYFLQCILAMLEDSLRVRSELNQEKFSEWLTVRRAQLERGELVYIAHQLDVVGIK